jgi:hypothetical protein
MLGDSVGRDEYIDQKDGRFRKIEAAGGRGRRLTGTGFGGHFTRIVTVDSFSPSRVPLNREGRLFVNICLLPFRSLQDPYYIMFVHSFSGALLSFYPTWIASSVCFLVLLRNHIALTALTQQSGRS